MSRIEVSLSGGAPFDHAVDDVASIRNARSAPHPSVRQAVSPPAARAGARLARPRYPSSRHPEPGRFLDEQLAPRVLDRNLLAPTTFSDVLEKARAGLAAAANRQSDDTPALNDAVQLLQTELGLRALVAMYRNAVLPG